MLDPSWIISTIKTIHLENLGHQNTIHHVAKIVLE